MQTIMLGMLLRLKEKETLKARVVLCKLKPHLAIIQVGDRLDSNVYIEQKIRFGEECGIRVSRFQYAGDVSEEELIDKVTSLNRAPDVSGIIVQLPLPTQFNKDRIINTINPAKDVDGITEVNSSLQKTGTPFFWPATAEAVLMLLREYVGTLSSKRIAVLGRSALVGTPVTRLLQREGAEVTICHSKTENTRDITKGKDIIVVAIGKAHTIDETYVSGGEIVVDVGITVDGVNGKRVLKGDVSPSVYPLLKSYSPVPGGVGPLTVFCLISNVILAEEMRII